MDLLAMLWDNGRPLLLVVVAGSFAVAVFRDHRRGDRPMLRGHEWAVVPLWLIAAGDAVLGDGRSPLDRSLKGALAAGLVLAFVVARWRRRRDRITAPADH